VRVQHVSRCGKSNHVQLAIGWTTRTVTVMVVVVVFKPKSAAHRLRSWHEICNSLGGSFAHATHGQNGDVPICRLDASTKVAIARGSIEHSSSTCNGQRK
jgi:hypothetical protein